MAKNGQSDRTLNLIWNIAKGMEFTLLWKPNRGNQGNSPTSRSGTAINFIRNQMIGWQEGYEVRRRMLGGTQKYPTHAT